MSSKVIRSLGNVVSSEDDARLFSRVFSDGLFTDVTITSLGAGKVHIPALYGIIQGRDFCTDQQDITVPVSPTGNNGVIIVKIDLNQAAASRVSIVGYLGHTLTVQDLNNGGKVAEMRIATYSADSTKVTTITTKYVHAANATNSTAYTNVTLAAKNWDTTNKVYQYSNSNIKYNSGSGKGTLQSWEPATNITLNQMKALQKAYIIDGGQTNGSATLKALGEVPTIDIPVRVRIFDYNSNAS